MSADSPVSDTVATSTSATDAPTSDRAVPGAIVPDFEKAGAFFLGHELEAATSGADSPVLLQSRHLTTHGVIVGMTGSGKTGLGIALLEEALIDNIPVIAVDPKGDLGNLLLTFPGPEPADLEPWVDPGAAATAGQSVEAFAAAQAALWRSGRARSGQSDERVERLLRTVEMTLYTPGSTAGVAIRALKSFAAPPAAVLDDPDLLRERIAGSAAGLLALAGLEPDPVSREQVLVANILQHAWDQGRDLDLAQIIGAIQSPPFERVGVLELERFYPGKDRFALAARLNNLLASPSFGAWLEGVPLDIPAMLHGKDGRPRASIINIAHLSEAERMFFVTLLMTEVLAWSRTLGGTSSLRALIYVDEVFGFLPPVAEPPSKRPLLTLMKQARAAGVGVVLSTQNPVDIDYKALSNAGTWMIGRLQTERDRDRLLDGLSSASGSVDAAALGDAIAALGKREFLLQSVHRGEPTRLKTRFVLAYLAGPLTRSQIRQLTESRRAALEAEEAGGSPAGPLEAADTAQDAVAEDAVAQPTPDPTPAVAAPTASPPATGSVARFYLARAPHVTGPIRYRPIVVGRVDVHDHSAQYGVDGIRTITLAAPIREGLVPVDWSTAAHLDFVVEDVGLEPEADATFAPLPAIGADPAAHRGWKKTLEETIRLEHPLTLWRSTDPKLVSEAGESEAAFRARLAHACREKRDDAAAALRARYEKRLGTVERRVERARDKVAKEQSQLSQRELDTAVSVGSAILGAFLGRKVASMSNVGRAGTAARSAGRVGREKADVERAQQALTRAEAELFELESELAAELSEMELATDPAGFTLETVTVRPRNADIAVRVFGLLWLPYVDRDGRLVPGWSAAA